MSGKIFLTLDWLSATSDQELPKYKAAIEKLMEDMEKMSPSEISEANVRFIAGYLERASGFERALEYIEVLNRKNPGESFYPVKIWFLLQHKQFDRTEAYIQELIQKKLSSPSLLLLGLKYYLSAGHKQQAVNFFSRLVSEHPNSNILVKAVSLMTAFNLDFDRSGFEQKVPWGSRFNALEKHIGQNAGDADLPDVHCINLDRSRERMTRCTDLYQDRAHVHRIPAVAGNTLPDYLLEKITINPGLPKSAIGCSLSHISAWEQTTRHQAFSPPRVIVEDDGLPLWINRSNYELIKELMAQQDIDLLYIQDRASPLEFAINDYTAGWKPEILPFQQGLDRFTKYRVPLPGGWGTDGYCLSEKGADKLMALFQRDGLANHIDWQTFLYSTADWSHPVASTKENVRINYSRVTGRTPALELNSGILNFPLITHEDFSQSTRH